MRLSVVRGSVCTMHRQIAGKLTGPVTKWVVLAFWIIALVASMPFAQKLTSVQDNQASSWLPASAESTKALDKLGAFQDRDDIPTTVVYVRKGGLTDADFAAIADQAAQFAKLDGVQGKGNRPGVLFPTDAASGQKLQLVSRDGEVAATTITLNFGKNGWSALADSAKDVRKIAHIDGVEVHLAGIGGQAADSASAFGGIDGRLLFATLGVVIVILLFTYRSPVLWLLPIISAMVALMGSQALIYGLVKQFGLTVNGQSQGILTVLVVGAGTDYALLLVARYREELRNHANRHEAMAFALHRAAPAIMASAATVIVGMLCLGIAEMNSTAGLGPVAAIGVGVTFLVMITLLPALLVIFGRWIFWPLRPEFGSHEPTSTGLWAKVGSGIARRPRRVWVTTAVLLGIACLGLIKLDANGLTTEEQYTKEFDSLKGQSALAEHGMVDISTPIQVITNPEEKIAVVAAIRSVPGIGEVNDAIPPINGVQLISITQANDAADPVSTAQVAAVRDAVHSVKGSDALVGGSSAFYVDIHKAAARDNRVIIPTVLVVVLLILMLLLRAVLAPLILMATVVLSFGAALGLSTLIFHYVLANLFAHGEGFLHADSAFPLFVFVFLVALGIDYNIFLMTRVREETMTKGTRRGSLVALSATGGVITSAGLVLAATFAVLGTLPLVFLAEMGTAVALGVMIDTLIVRSVLVTAINLDLGDKIWWPSKLAQGKSDPEDASELVNV
jgi:RND superfamily putative drug exporter